MATLRAALAYTIAELGIGELSALMDRVMAVIEGHDAAAAAARNERLAAIEERLRAAEAVCVMYGISPAHVDTEREKAAYEVWLNWASLVGPGATTTHPDLTDKRIAELARQREAKRAKALEAIGKILGAS